MVKNTPASAGDARDSGSILGQEDPLEEEMATHASILAWKIPWTEELGRRWSHKESDTTEHTHTSSFIYLLIDTGTPNLGVTNKVAINTMYNYLYRHVLSLLLGKCLHERWLGHKCAINF